MNNYAMVQDGYVVNIVMWDGTDLEQRPPPDVEMVLVGDKFAGPGFKYDVGTGEFTPPPQMTPGSNYDNL
jgi:hypothetical protein